jgi:hypothetical protein
LGPRPALQQLARFSGSLRVLVLTGVADVDIAAYVMMRVPVALDEDVVASAGAAPAASVMLPPTTSAGSPDSEAAQEKLPALRVLHLSAVVSALRASSFEERNSTTGAITHRLCHKGVRVLHIGFDRRQPTPTVAMLKLLFPRLRHCTCDRVPLDLSCAPIMTA